MTRNEIEKEVMEIVARQLSYDFPSDNINNNADIKNDLGGDSIDVIEIVFDCEKRFGISITDERGDHISTIGDICSIVEEEVKRNE